MQQHYSKLCFDTFVKKGIYCPWLIDSVHFTSWQQPLKQHPHAVPICEEGKPNGQKWLQNAPFAGSAINEYFAIRVEQSEENVVNFWLQLEGSWKVPSYHHNCFYSILRGFLIPIYNCAFEIRKMDHPTKRVNYSKMRRPLYHEIMVTINWVWACLKIERYDSFPYSTKLDEGMILCCITYNTKERPSRKMVNVECTY